MNSLFNLVFQEYKNIYINIFKHFYPKPDSRGFEERNLSHNFVNALLKSSNDKNAVPWFEVAWNSSEKIDAIVFLPALNSVFFVEAKRFSNQVLKKKINSLNDDFNRLFKGFENRNEILSRWKSDNKFENQYIVCLADVWKEADDTFKIAEQWTSKRIKDIHNIEFSAFEKNNTISEKIDFADFYNEFSYYSNSLNLYNLLISITKIG